MRRADFDIDELIKLVENPAAEKRCLFVRSLGFIYSEGAGAEKTKARRKLIELLADGDESVRYPAYWSLRDVASDADNVAEVEAALKAFESRPQNAAFVSGKRG